MTKTIRVLHVIPSLAPCRGGPSKAAIGMVSALNKQGVCAEIATTNDNGDQILDVPLNQLVEFEGVPTRFFSRYSPNIRAVREFAFSKSFKRWIDQNLDQFDLVHVHAIFSFSSTYAMLCARRKGIPYVVRPIGQLEQWAIEQSKLRKRLYLWIIERKNLSNASMIHCTAQSEKQQALKVLHHQGMKVIPLGLPLPEIIGDARTKLIEKYSLKAQDKIILFLARLHPKKGLELLFEALSTIDSGWQLLIVGDGDSDYVEKLHHLVKQNALSSKVRFTGFLDGVDKNLALQGADLYALTSYSENFGISVLEALASDTPVMISSGVALSKEVAELNLGKVCECNVKSISDSLNEMLSESSFESGRSAVEQYFSWNSVSRQLIDKYREILTKGTESER